MLTQAEEGTSSTPIGSQLLVDMSSGQTIASTNADSAFSSEASSVVLKLYAALEYLNEHNHPLEKTLRTEIKVK